MEITKNYDVEILAKVLLAEIEKSDKNNNGVVRLSILAAYDILDVLNEINRRDKKTNE